MRRCALVPVLLFAASLLPTLAPVRPAIAEPQTPARPRQATPPRPAAPSATGGNATRILQDGNCEEAEFQDRRRHGSRRATNCRRNLRAR